MVKSETRRDALTLVWKSKNDTWKNFNQIPARDSVQRNQAWDFILRKSQPVLKTVRSETWTTRYSKLREGKKKSSMGNLECYLPLEATI